MDLKLTGTRRGPAIRMGGSRLWGVLLLLALSLAVAQPVGAAPDERKQVQREKRRGKKAKPQAHARRQERLAARRLSMNPTTMKAIVDSLGSKVEVQGSMWRFQRGPATVILVYDESHDRMRLLSPVAELSQISDKQLRAAMEANFHTSLDARYASSDGMLYAAFLHPLSSLTEADLRSAIDQVATLALTFGDDYSSGVLQFGGGGGGGSGRDVN